MTNKSLKYLLALPLLALPAVVVAQPVYTDPVGAVSVDKPTGLYATSFPFQKAKTYQGAVGSVSATTVNLAGVPSLSGAYYLQVLSGSAAGAVVNILSSTGSSVTLESSISGLAASDSVAIREHTTLADLSAAGSLPDSSTVTFYNLDGSVSVFEVFSGEWFDPDFNSADDVVIFPGEGFALRLSSAASLVFTGSVAVDPVNVPLSSNIAFVGSLNPVPSVTNPSSIGEIFPTLSDSSTITAYVADGSYAVTDNFEIFSGEWFDGDFNSMDGFTLAAPGAFVVRPTASATATIPPAFVTPAP